MSKENIATVQAFQTEDGKLHKTMEWAVYHLAEKAMEELLAQGESADPINIMNRMSGTHNRRIVRNWLNATDALEKSVMGQ